MYYLRPASLVGPCRVILPTYLPGLRQDHPPYASFSPNWVERMRSSGAVDDRGTSNSAALGCRTDHLRTIHHAHREDVLSSHNFNRLVH